ncbi:hypothetical protein FRB98_006280 [Tulasnella sp. 332]|nr:hypothetical protein FRB98_006280 [Tulasnella sp. 332]
MVLLFSTEPEEHVGGYCELVEIDGYFFISQMGDQYEDRRAFMLGGGKPSLEMVLSGLRGERQLIYERRRLMDELAICNYDIWKPRAWNERSSTATLGEHHGPKHPAESNYRPLPPLKEQDALEKQWLNERYARVPGILKKYGFDVLLMSQREYAEDTVFRSLISSTTQFSARRRTIYLFHTKDVVKTGLANPTIWIDNTPAIWGNLSDALDTINPGKIAVNIDPELAFSDGLHTGEGRTLFKNLPQKWADRCASERMIPVEIINLRAGGESQLNMYRLMMENVWAMIAEGFSLAVIEPGVTTAEDVEWWFRSRMQTMNVTTWFHPSVTVFGPGKPGLQLIGADKRNYFGPQIIHEGDMLHVDIGITAMNMNTDTQHLAYVLRSKLNETAPPQGLIDGLKQANDLQDSVQKWMKIGFEQGQTGDWVLVHVREQMEEEGREGLIYCHPIEWDMVQAFPLEEDVGWSEATQGWEWIWGRQERFHLIG